MRIILFFSLFQTLFAQAEGTLFKRPKIWVEVYDKTSTYTDEVRRGILCDSDLQAVCRSFYMDEYLSHECGPLPKSKSKNDELKYGPMGPVSIPVLKVLKFSSDEGQQLLDRYARDVRPEDFYPIRSSEKKDFILIATSLPASGQGATIKSITCR